MPQLGGKTVAITGKAEGGEAVLAKVTMIGYFPPIRYRVLAILLPAEI